MARKDGVYLTSLNQGLAPPGIAPRPALPPQFDSFRRRRSPADQFFLQRPSNETARFPPRRAPLASGCRRPAAGSRHFEVRRLADERQQLAARAALCLAAEG